MGVEDLLSGWRHPITGYTTTSRTFHNTDCLTHTHTHTHTHTLRNIILHIYLIKVSIWTVTTIIICFNILRNNIICRNLKRPWPAFISLTFVNNTYIVSIAPQGISRSTWGVNSAHVWECLLSVEITTRRATPSQWLASQIRIPSNTCVFRFVVITTNHVARYSFLHSESFSLPVSDNGCVSDLGFSVQEHLVRYSILRLLIAWITQKEI
jgi:hypothetical protein